MALLEFSAGFMSGYPQRIIGVNTSPGTANSVSNSKLLGYPNSSGADAHQFRIMKGTAPADFSTLTTYGSRSSDVLAVYATNYTFGAGVFSITDTTVNPVVVQSVYFTASASGTATWFWWTVTQLPSNGASPPSAGAVPLQQIIGTVGAPGSGADLEVYNTTLTAGDPLRVLNFKISFPSSWTY